jgi:hypothetical protein
MVAVSSRREIKGQRYRKDLVLCGKDIIGAVFHSQRG